MKKKHTKHRLKPSDLTFHLPSGWLNFTTTKELGPHDGVIGQERAMKAVETGLEIPTRGYNIFAVGEPGSGKTSTLKRILTAKAENEPIGQDLCYIYNFSSPDRPQPMLLPAGEGRKLAKEMERLVKELKKMIPRILLEGASGHIRAGIIAETKARADELTIKASRVANDLGLILQESENALHVLPLYRGKPLTESKMEQLPDRTRRRMEKKIIEFQEKAESFAYARRQLEIDHDERVRAAEIRAITPIVEERFRQVSSMFMGVSDEVITYLDEVLNHCIENYHLFVQDEQDSDEQDSLPFALLEPSGGDSDEDPEILYNVNVLIDRSQETGAPVVVERIPTAAALCGAFEYRETPGGLSTDHTLLRAGALHQANGGYLLLQAQELLSHENSWNSLKRALRHKEIAIDEGMGHGDRPKLAGALKPGAVALNTKVVLVGGHEIYYILNMEDENFGRLFKILADFEPSMAGTKTNVMKMARFAGQVCREEGYLPIHRSGVARLVEYAARRAAQKHKMITKQAALLDLLAEANMVAVKHKSKSIRKTDVDEAIDAREHRHASISESVAREIDAGTILIKSSGAAVGQINGIAVYDVGGFAFGTPVRITARTYVGRKGVVNIDREVHLSGAIHDKGSLIMIGYVGGRFAQKEPLAFSASITFEQSYDEIDGDSASSAELYTLLSSLSGCPINQGIAVTGSVNQLGELQPIGGVNEKIEGVFDMCQRRGLTGNEGVLIPTSNVKNLMLKKEVIEAVRKGVFNIYAVSSIDEGIEVLTGIKAGKRLANGTWEKNSINYRVQQRLNEFVSSTRDDIRSALNCEL
ncbi:MAG: AAA family ATPase [Deltaproteobacteria bacterium]|nr:AAA family ATPase [Deltaproteobacteria bacterium]MBN2671215.1 AAA family ATPase [Deltaproteobacteria bacterium]